MRPLALLLLASAAFAGGWKTLIAPGPLIEAHAPFGGDCDQCHLVFDGVPDAKCLDCHEGLASRIADDRGFHADVGPCLDCHADHRGEATRPEALAAFDHAATGFVLHGAHESVTCDTCHTRPIDEMQAVCIECHAEGDPHGSALGPDCDACHAPTDWRHDLKTRDAHDVAMDGGHTDLQCEDCHPQGAHLATDTRCNDCHPDAHGGTTTTCGGCHVVAGWTPADFDHGPCTCTFAGAHQTAPCLSCHPGFTFTDTPVLCSGCHLEDLGHDPLGECSRCHEATSWKENTFDHQRSDFPLEGKHLEVDCAGCHTDGFRGLPTACAECHGPAEHGDFGACERCHDAEGFAPSSFDHAVFPLTGRHTAVACRECHP